MSSGRLDPRGFPLDADSEPQPEATNIVWEDGVEYCCWCTTSPASTQAKMICRVLTDEAFGFGALIVSDTGGAMAPGARRYLP
jgi:hypothetical protein